MPHDDSLEREVDMLLGPDDEATEHAAEVADTEPPSPCAVALGLAWRLRNTEGAARATLGWAVVGLALDGPEPTAPLDAGQLAKLVGVQESTARGMLRELADLGVLDKGAKLDPESRRAVPVYTVAEPAHWGHGG